VTEIGVHRYLSHSHHQERSGVITSEGETVKSDVSASGQRCESQLREEGRGGILRFLIHDPPKCSS